MLWTGPVLQIKPVRYLAFFGGFLLNQVLSCHGMTRVAALQNNAQIHLPLRVHTDVSGVQVYSVAPPDDAETSRMGI
jgi:hypothetical protein